MIRTPQLALRSVSWGGYTGGGHATGDTLISIASLLGSKSGDILIGKEVDNRIERGAGNDYLDDMGGNDLLLGGDGDDRLVGSEGADLFAGGSGADVVNYYASSGAVTVRLWGGCTGGGHATGDTLIDIENITGSKFGDILVGNGVDNRIDGGGNNGYLDGMGGDDILIGGSVDDRIAGGLGNGTLEGGIGRDTFTFSSTLGLSNIDHIVDFSADDDMIRIDAAVFTGAGLTAGAFRVDALVSGSEASTAEHRIVYNRRRVNCSSMLMGRVRAPEPCSVYLELGRA